MNRIQSFMMGYKYRRETARQFNRDGEKALAQIAEARFGARSGNCA